ncbi:hypothetical protein J4Q44_G00266210 [Coregonus suidteri]|uniref:Uncharacterized protein n=1 Tax=Coregonus suidteri TaxID=861788 RepID=A0AAN8LJY5_9TELE
MALTGMDHMVRSSQILSLPQKHWQGAVATCLQDIDPLMYSNCFGIDMRILENP